MYHQTNRYFLRESRPLYLLSTFQNREVEDDIQLQKTELQLPNGSKTYMLETAEGDSSKPPIVVCHGFSNNPWTMKDTMGALHKQTKRKVVAYDLHSGYNITDDSLQQTEQYSKAIDGWSEALIQCMQVSGVQNADIVGHSMGGATAAVASYKMPELFSDVTMVNPAGMVQDAKIGTGAYKETVRDVFRSLFSKYPTRKFANLARDWGRSINYVGKNLRNTIAEVQGASGLRIYELLNLMKTQQQYQHLRLRVVSTEDDKMFTKKDMKETLQLAGYPPENMTFVEGGHSKILEDSDAIVDAITEQSESALTIEQSIALLQTDTRASIDDLLADPIVKTIQNEQVGVATSIQDVYQVQITA